MKINNKKIILYPIIFFVTISLIYLKLSSNHKKLSIENNYVHEELKELPIEDTYEIYAHNTIYLLTSIHKYLIDIDYMISENGKSKETDDFITSQINSIVETTYEIGFPKPIDENTNQIYNFIKHDLYLALKEMSINIEKEIKTNKKSYKNLTEYTNYIRKLTLDNKILDINLNTKNLKSSKLSISNKEVIIIIAKETDKMKKIINTLIKQ